MTQVRNKELLLQITIDNFNRHYVYRHDLTSVIVQDTYNYLLKYKQTTLEESMVLDYHLLFLEYLKFKMHDDMIDEKNYCDLLERVMNTCKRCQSSFYTLKLYMLEIYVRIDLELFSDADTCLSKAFEFAYKKDMRSYIYKLTYVKAHILIFQDDPTAVSDSYQQIFLAFQQMMEQHKDAPNDLMREIFLVVRMAHFIEEHGFSFVEMFAKFLSDASRNLLQELCKYISGEHVEKKNLFDMQSYFTFNNISFPNI